MTTFHGGRLPNDPSKPRLKLGEVLTEASPTFPATQDYLSKVDSFPMYLNDQIGDCTCATMGHAVQIFTTYGEGETITVTDNDVLAAYEAVSGYNPSTGKNDNGAQEQDVLNYWRKTGLAGHKILAFAEVDVKNEDELHAGLNLFGTLYLGINFPESAMEQFNKGEAWDVVPGAKIEGGHAINAGFYDVDSNMWKIVTWGKVQPMTDAFFKEYVEEAWIVVSPEWFNAQGNDPTGLNLASLGEQFASLTGEPNPFTAPPPAPVTSDPFLEQIKTWAEQGSEAAKVFEQKIETWLKKEV